MADVEAMFLSLHVKCTRAASRYLPPRTRFALEVLVLLVGFVLLGALVAFHVQHVRLDDGAAAAKPACFPALRDTVNRTRAHIVRLTITERGWSGNAGAGSAPFGTMVGGASEPSGDAPEFLFSSERGLFMLSEAARSEHRVTELRIELSPLHACFGSWYLQLAARNWVGYDTILKNEFLREMGNGFLLNLNTKDLFPLDRGDGLPAAYLLALVFKVQVLITVSFLFFAVTALVSFTLRQTQSRMLSFTTHLQRAVRSGHSYWRLVVQHVLSSVSFVPSVIGILFFLLEFFNDQVLAFVTLIMAWLVECYTLIVVRTRISMKFFPKAYGIYFFLFGLYFFSFPYGFHFLAMLNCIVFLLHAMIFFWSRWEIPAIEAGDISAQRPRQLAVFAPAAPVAVGIVAGAAEGDALLRLGAGENAERHVGSPHAAAGPDSLGAAPRSPAPLAAAAASSPAAPSQGFPAPPAVVVPPLVLAQPDPASFAAWASDNSPALQSFLEGRLRSPRTREAVAAMQLRRRRSSQRGPSPSPLELAPSSSSSAAASSSSSASASVSVAAFSAARSASPMPPAAAASPSLAAALASDASRHPAADRSRPERYDSLDF